MSPKVDEAEVKILRLYGQEIEQAWTALNEAMENFDTTDPSFVALYRLAEQVKNNPRELIF